MGAKALMIMISLFGVSYLLTFIEPNEDNNPLIHTVFQAMKVLLLSTQGAVITLPYCYLDTEVQEVLRTRWKRWRMVRSTGMVTPSIGATARTVHCTQMENDAESFHLATTKLDSA